jgi:catechol 2,3-dioxygenase-like lactoylglutathione lyase family enzyme
LARPVEHERTGDRHEYLLDHHRRASYDAPPEPDTGGREEHRHQHAVGLHRAFDDQDKALAFYTNALGFVKKQDFPVGRFRWLTVVSQADRDGVELLLEPNDNPAARTFQEALFEQGIPATTFGVDDLEREYERLQKLGVVFRTKPTRTGPVLTAVLEDTCGNLIQLAQK